MSLSEGRWKSPAPLHFLQILYECFLMEERSMNKKDRLLALVMAAVMLMSVALTGCNEPGGEEKSYTLNESLSASPTNWNPHTWETNADNYLAAYCEMGLVDISIAEDGINYMWVYEMATAIDDITKDFPDKAKWGIEEDEGRVFKITLNPDATWEDGSKINADTYVYSMQALLDPQMQNSRARTYYIGSTAILNAGKYFYSETPIYNPVVPAYVENDTPDYSYDITKNPVYINPTSYNMTLTSSYSISDFADMGYVDSDIYASLTAEANACGFVEVTRDNEADVKKVATDILAVFGLDFSEDYYKEMLFYNTGEFSEKYSFDNVGLYKSGDYELIYITAQPVQMFNFLAGMTSNWIVKEDLYEGGKDTAGDLVTTNYGTSKDTYMSFGPYKLTSFETDKQVVMEKNDNWYGYKDGKHKGQFQTTAIQCDIVADHNTALQLFNQGKLDSVDLTSDDMPIYRMSDSLLKTGQTYIFRYIFATDINKLIALEKAEGSSVNKRVLSYDDFRKAISLSIDRTTFCNQATPGYKPAYYLFNNLYYYDIANNTESIYRNSTAAKEAILNLYGIEYGDGKTYKTVDEVYTSITGYDVEEARALFQSVYEQAKKDGNYTDGQKININCMASAAVELDADDLKQEQLLNQFVTEATKDTGFEGKITFKFNCGSQKRYRDVSNGAVEMIRGAWGGAAFEPVSTIRVYTEPDYMGGLDKIHESCGWNPTRETLTITVDVNGDGNAEETTHTIQDWAKLINGGIRDEIGHTIKAGITNADAQLTVLAALETAVLSSYQCIPFASRTVCSLYSKQLKHATLDYNIMYGYGGIRLLTYNYDDVAWDKYVASQGGILSYE